MGKDKIRHFRTKGGRHFWEPSATIKALGPIAEALGDDEVRARKRAIALNEHADALRRAAAGSPPAKEGTFAKLFKDYQESPEFAKLKPRTQETYAYYLEKIEADFGDDRVADLTTRAVKVYQRRMEEKSVTWAFHIVGTLRMVLSWARAEDWIEVNPALNIRLRAPRKRDVIWLPEEAARYLPKALELGWHSIHAMVQVFDSIGQAPIDVRTLRRKQYDGRAIHGVRSKTGVGDVPLPLFPEAVKALDEYLATQPAKLPDAPLFTHDRTGKAWNRFTLNRMHRAIREAAGLRKELQLQDFRTTVLTEGAAADGTVDQLRGLARHKTRAAGEHYVMPSPDAVESIQAKRLAKRKRER